MEILLDLLIFAFVGAGFVFANLLAGRIVRPRIPSAEKNMPYECGEVPIGPGWVQFNPRFYIVALLFLIFDVEVVLLYPWAIVWGDAARLAHELGTDLFTFRSTALIDLLLFFGLILLGFAYLWRFGYLDWVRATGAAPEERA